MSFHSAVFGGDDWLASWTIFYWAWWISWTPVRRHLHRPDLPRPHHT
ncbi:BCCT family transporter [Cryobacterium sp. TMT2-15-1]|nr:BCCT family transporter [Cryobacterium sp. TMT2-15-1]